jgi:catechol O-methyltransferase
LKAIDEYARTRKYLMNVGEDKGSIVTDIIRKTKPKVMVELGGYCGYSTILFGAAVRDEGGDRYFSLERSPKFAKNIEELVEFAGLSDVVKVIVGASDEGIKKLHSTGQLKSIDMMFLDHYKPAYTTDLKLCEHLGLIHKCTVLAADNVISPGNPPYLEYVRSTVEEKRAAITRNQEKPDTDHDAFKKRSAAQYGEVETLSTAIKGNPNLIYQSKLINSYEPTGVPVRTPSNNYLEYISDLDRMVWRLPNV